MTPLAAAATARFGRDDPIRPRRPDSAATARRLNTLKGVATSRSHMSAVDVAVYAVHMLFAGLWTGSVAFVTLAVLPTARDGTANAAPLVPVVGRLRWITRISALLMLLTGGHMAGTRYTVGSLTGSTRGHLVLAMVALWLILAVLVEIGAGRLADGLDRQKVREPAREARPFLLAATAVAVLLLLDAGVLMGGLIFGL